MSFFTSGNKLAIRPNGTNSTMSFLHLDFDFSFVFIIFRRSICIKAHDADHGAGLVPWGDNNMCFVKMLYLRPLPLIYPALAAKLQFAFVALLNTLCSRMNLSTENHFLLWSITLLFPHKSIN